ncbi:MAG: hypothetical protein EBU70_12090 [Actinobacteria bacterium]|nr:hypothetical protein [Actinomycetota bacterium]
MHNESFEAYETMRNLEDARASGAIEEFAFFLLVLLLMALRIAVPALIIRRIRAGRRAAGARSGHRGLGRP